MTNAADLEDAHNGEIAVEHLRIVTPVPPRKRRIDKADVVIYGGWVLAAVALLAMLVLLVILLLR